MITGKKLPIVNENIKMKKALKIINNKKLGVLIIKKKNGDTIWNNYRWRFKKNCSKI